MSTQVKAWKCDYCGKAAINRGAISQHEDACANNPRRRHCRTCRHGGFKQVGTGIDEHRELWCFEMDKPMSEKPYFEDCDHYGSPWGDTEQPIPFTCACYERKDNDDGE